MKRRGFTLIELLTVIGMIVLLIGILLPALSRGRQMAKRTICASNMRGLMQAVFLYANDNHDRIVSAGLAHGGSGNEHAAWINLLKEHYGGEELIARCPADESEHWEVPVNSPSSGLGDPDNPDNSASAPPILRRTSFGTNYYTVARIGKAGPYNQLRLIQRPGTTVHMVELVEVGSFAASDHVHPETWWSNPLKLASEEMELDRHLGKANYSFFDGHAGTHGFEETYLIDRERSTLRNIVWNHNYYNPSIGH